MNGCYQTTTYAAGFMTQRAACQALYGGTAGWTLAYATNAAQWSDIVDSDCAGTVLGYNLANYGPGLNFSTGAFWIGLYDGQGGPPIGSSLNNSRAVAAGTQNLG